MFLHFLFTLLALFINCSICNAKLLKLRPFFGQSESQRTVRLDVFIRYLDKTNAVQKSSRQNVENGQTFVMHLPNVDETTANFNICFFIYVKAMKDEYKADTDDENPSDEGPFIEPNFNIELEDIQTMFSMAYVTLYKPNFSKLYTVNLGQIDPPGLFLNRRVFFERKVNADETTGHIYYALLHGTAKRHRRNGKTAEAEREYLLGCAPLLLNKNNGIFETANLTTDHWRGKSENLSQFHLSIAVHLAPLLKHILWLLNLTIYHLKENDFGGDCLRLKNWIERAEKEPNLMDRPKLVLADKILPLFDGAQNISRNIFSNPLAELFRIANESSDDFEQRNAKGAIENINEKINLMGEKVKKMMEKLGIGQSEAENVIGIGPKGIVKNDKILQVVQRIGKHSYLKETIEKADEIIGLIESAEKNAKKEAAEALETLETISEENGGDKIVIRKSDRNIK